MAQVAARPRQCLGELPRPEMQNDLMQRFGETMTDPLGGKVTLPRPGQRMFAAHLFQRGSLLLKQQHGNRRALGAWDSVRLAR